MLACRGGHVEISIGLFNWFQSDLSHELSVLDQSWYYSVLKSVEEANKHNHLELAKQLTDLLQKTKRNYDEKMKLSKVNDMNQSISEQTTANIDDEFHFNLEDLTPLIEGLNACEQTQTQANLLIRDNNSDLLFSKDFISNENHKNNSDINIGLLDVNKHNLSDDYHSLFSTFEGFETSGIYNLTDSGADSLMLVEEPKNQIEKIINCQVINYRI